MSYDITRLTKEEINTITDRQPYYDYAIMAAGLVKTNAPAFLDVKSRLKPTVKMYKCGGLLFETQSDADTFSNLHVFSENYKWNCGYDYKYKEKLANDIITTVSLYNEHEIESIEQDLVKDKKHKEKYDSDLAAYKENEAKIYSVIQEVDEYFNAANTLFANVDRIQTQYVKNLELSNNDSEIAFKFLEKQFDNERYTEAMSHFKENHLLFPSTFTPSGSPQGDKIAKAIL